jgi:hypothetical protein
MADKEETDKEEPEADKEEPKIVDVHIEKKPEDVWAKQTYVATVTDEDGNVGSSSSTRSAEKATDWAIKNK